MMATVYIGDPVTQGTKGPCHSRDDRSENSDRHSCVPPGVGIWGLQCGVKSSQDAGPACGLKEAGTASWDNGEDSPVVALYGVGSLIHGGLRETLQTPGDEDYPTLSK